MIRRKANKAGVDLVKQYEGLSLTPYLCPAGFWTVGYGHATNVDPHKSITEETANALLEQDLVASELVVSKSVLCPLTDNQFSALVSLCFNVGPKPLYMTLGGFLNASTPDYQRAADQFLRWNKATVGGKLVVLPGLTRRREAERELFLKHD